MSDITIYDGTSTFAVGMTPFQFYDYDPVFREDADKVTKWCALRLGWPMENIELGSGSFYAAFEEAVTVYGNEVYQWKIRENYISLEGNSNQLALNEILITPSLGNIIRLAKNYGSEAGSGGNVTYYRGNLPVTSGTQVYDLNAWAEASASLTPGDSIEIKRIFHELPPAILRYFDPYAGTGTGIQSLLEVFGYGAYSPGVNFMMMPIYFDIQKIQAIELNDQIRKSSYSFEIQNNQLKLFPIPTFDYNMWFEYIKISERDSVNKNISGSNLVTNVSNVPFNNPVYGDINSIGRSWIFAYTLCVVKEMLGYVRGKYKTIPIPGDEVTLNADDLLNDARKEKDKLIEDLRIMLEDSSRTKQMEKKSNEEDYLQKSLLNIPLPIYIG